MAINKFEIPPRSRRCARGGEEFHQGMEYYSALDDAENGGYSRRDFCVACWEKMLADSQENSFGKAHWKSSVPIRKQESLSSQERDERAMELLKDIHQSSDEEEGAEAFVLALLLARNKKLFLKEEIVEGDVTILLYEAANTEEMIPVKKIALSAIQTDKIQNSLAKKLSL